jgi:4-amino-4-deoxy-L-arabinose transferase-like glycosyltransferase
MDRSVRSPAVVAAILAVAALAVALHVLELASLRRVSHDDTISFLAATGHQGEFQHIVDEELEPVAQWVPASRWQALTRIEQPLPLLTIARDLGHHDIHPPVYFWLLHVWSLLVGVHLWTGPLLNVALHVATAVVLWRLARRVLHSPLAAWAVTGVWATLPAVVETVGSSRQYSLSALLSVLVAAAFLRAREEPTVGRLAVVAAWTALGMLTLYSFGLVVAGLGMVSAADLLRADRRRAALRSLGAFAVGGVVFLAGQPWLREVLARQRDQAEVFTVPRMLLRVRLLREGMPSFAVADLPVTAGLVLLAATAALAVLAWRARPQARPLVLLAVWLPTALALAFLAAVSPGAAWQARYFSIALPFVAFLPAAAWPALRVRVAGLRPVPAIGVAVFVAAAVVNLSAFATAANAPPAETLDGPDPAVLDNMARGVLLRILWDAPPDLPVYAADQETLLATTDRWLRCTPDLPCHARPVTLATQVQYEATAAGQQALLSAAREVRQVSPAPAIDAISERYRLSAPTAVASSTAGDGRGGVVQAGARSRTASTTTQISTTARSDAATASAPYGADGE